MWGHGSDGEPTREPGISSVSDKQVTAAGDISILMAHGQDLVASGQTVA